MQLDRLSPSSLIVVAAFAVATAGCSDDPEPECRVGEQCPCETFTDCPNPVIEQCVAGACVVESETDTGTDTAPDAPEDAGPDAVVEDVAEDAEVGQDTEVDAPADAPADAPVDAEPDAEPDAPEVDADASADGDAAVEDTEDAGPTPPDPVLNPWIAFVSAPPGGLEVISVVRTDGTGTTRIDTGDPIQLEPAWSPDGTRLAFRTVGPSAPVLRVVDVTTAEVITLETGLVTFSGPTWSPDGTMIAVEGAQTSGEGINNDIFIVPVDGSEVTALTATDHSEAAPFWVSDDVIYYVSNLTGLFEVYSHTMSTDAVVPTTTGSQILGGADVSWDGVTLIYRARTGPESGQLLTMDTTTFIQRNIGDSLARDAAISPDGLWFVYVDPSGQADLVAVDLFSLERILTITGTEEAEFSPAISPVESETITLATFGD